MQTFTFGAKVAIDSGRVFRANFTASSADKALENAREYARQKTAYFNVTSVEYKVNGYTHND